MNNNSSALRKHTMEDRRRSSARQYRKLIGLGAISLAQIEAKKKRISEEIRVTRRADLTMARVSMAGRADVARCGSCSACAVTA